MKKLILCFVIFLGLSLYANADEYLLFTGKCYEYNSIGKSLSNKDFALKYDDESDVFYLRTSDWMNDAWIHLSWKDLDKLRKIFEKYFEWEKLAVEKQITLEKEIPDSTIKTKVTWEFGDNWYSDKNFILGFIFFSQSSTRHQLVLQTSKAIGSNQFVTYKIDGYYFDKHQVQIFLDSIDEEKIKKQIEKFKKDKEQKDLFN